MLTKDQVRRMKEDELRRDILIPLLEKMGFRDVYEHHGGETEQGKDIVCWKPDALDNRRNYALVVKATTITGDVAKGKGSVANVSTQIHQCFGHPFADANTGEACEVHECWVVTNQKFTNPGRASLHSVLVSTGKDRNVTFIDIDRLWRLIKKHWPQALWLALEEARRELANWDTHYKSQVQLTNTGIELKVEEKYPGAAQEKPLTMQFQAAFPDTPEGRAAKEALERSLATGAPATIPGKFVQVTFPEWFASFLGEQAGKITAFQMRSNPPPIPLLLRMEFMPDDGDPFVLEYLDLRIVQAGQEEITLSNKDQPIPIQIELVVRPKEQKAEFSFSIKPGLMTVTQMLTVLQFLTSMSKPGTGHAIWLNTGFPVFELRYAAVREAPDSDFMQGIEDLAVIQVKTRRPLVLPDREFTQEEIKTIEKLRRILHEGTVSVTWERFGVAGIPDMARVLLNDLGGGKTGPIRVVVPDSVELFGVNVPLGLMTVHAEGSLENEEEVRQQIAAATNSEAEINIYFVSGDNKSAVFQYLDWQPQTPQPQPNETEAS